MYQNELYHYGVKGMRWGVRKNKSEQPSKRQQRKRIKQQLKNLKNAQKERYATTDITQMSIQELRDMNARIREEDAYKKAMTPESSLLQKGMKVTGDIIKGPVGKVAGAAISTYAAYKGYKWIDKHNWGDDAINPAKLFYDYMKPKK